MSNHNRIPDIILEASPHNFGITKNHINDPQSTHQSPEIYTKKIIMAWMEANTTAMERNKRPRAWESYHIKFGQQVVIRNDWFPSSLPIGYVLVCFFISVNPSIVTVDSVKKIFNQWVQNDDIRKAVFDAHRHDEFFTDRVEISVETDSPDGLQLGKALYDTSQKDMFGQ